MTDIKVQFEVQLTSDSPPGPHPLADSQEDVSVERESGFMESPHNTGLAELEEQLSLLTDALAPPCGDHAACSYDFEDRPGLGLGWTELQFQFLMSRADDLHDCLVNGHGHPEREALAAEVTRFLYTCQPYFNHLESTSTVSQHTFQPFDIYTGFTLLPSPVLLDFSQQLCDRLEQLVLTYAGYNLLCLDETESNSVSHFCIGQRQLGPLRVTMFRYCKPTAYLARVDTGVFKRMRWNVETLRGETDGQSDESEAQIVGNAEYYFLCYEDIPNAEAGSDSQGVSHGNVVRMWSIGQWVQVTPETDDIYDWIMCAVPQGNYQRLLFLGSDEPSIRSATDYLQQLLLSHQTAE